MTNPGQDEQAPSVHSHQGWCLSSSKRQAKQFPIWMSSALKDALRHLLEQVRGEIICIHYMVTPAPSQTTGNTTIEHAVVFKYHKVI
jgi:hypothetical protein